MSLFWLLLGKIFPLYLLIVLGFAVRKLLPIKKEAVANLLIYVIVPIVSFIGVSRTQLTAATLSLPLLFLAAHCIISTIVYYGSGVRWHDDTRNMLGFIAGSANTGYFGIPVAVALYGHGVVGTVALCVLGGSVYNSTYGYFLAARGSRTVRQSLFEVVKLPVMYAVMLGLLAHGLHWDVVNHLGDVLKVSNVALTVFGMMLIGMGLADIKKYEHDWPFLGVVFAGKFLLWPLFMSIILLIDAHTWHIYSHATRSVILMLSAVPVAANIVAYATILKSHPEKSSLAVFLSTLFALVWLPLVVSLLT